MHRTVREVATRVRHNPAQNISIILAVALAVVGLGTGLRMLSPDKPQPEAEPEATLAKALAALDAEEFERARSIAADLRLRDDLPADEIGGPAYVLGIVMAEDAALEWAERERKIRFLLAARYLEEARADGFPAGREEHGLFRLGKAFHDGGRFDLCLPPLHEALRVFDQGRTEIHGLLMDAFLRDSHPDYEQALEHSREYLSDDALAVEQRNEALLTQSEILFRLKDLTICEATLSMIPVTSRQHPYALLLRGRLSLREGEQLASSDPLDERTSAEAIARYTAARDSFATAQTEKPSDEVLARQVQYLIGITYRRVASLQPTGPAELTDLRAALDQFARTRRSHFGTPEGISSSLEEAEIQQLLGDDAAAVQSFHRTVRFAADQQPYNNPWTPLPELQARVEAAYAIYRHAGEFDAATRLAEGMTAVFPESRAVQLQAEARQAAATHLTGEAEGLPHSQAEPLLAQARGEHRQAGALFARLAKLRFATRQYPDDLWNSAENYLDGHDYEQAVRFYKQFLDTQGRTARPPALTSLGEALLALNKPEEALPWLMECIDYYPKDPHSYRARVTAAAAQRELGNIGQAKALLNGNLEHEALTPRSIEWRDSLFALGELFYLEGLAHETQSRMQGVNHDLPATRKAALKRLELAQQSFHQAIAKLTEGVQRDPQARQTVEAKYQIAESHRHAAKLPRKRIPTVTIDTTRKQLNAEIAAELTQAEAVYRELRDHLNAKEEQSELTGVERRILRNCYFGRADALYDMQRYDKAIQAYSNATSRYQHQPESLEAYVQIANCHRRLNRVAEARGTLEQAKVILERISADADFRQTTRYNREEWGNILDWLGTL